MFKYINNLSFILFENKNLNNNKIMSRNAILTSEIVKKTSNLFVYNGLKFLKIDIFVQMCGFKLGMFSFTRKVPVHPTNKRIHLAKKFKKKQFKFLKYVS